MAMADVTIRGAGIFGLSVAWACLLRGARVQVIDPGGVAAGSSGGVVGALAPHTPENWNDKKQFQFESLMMAEHYWSAVAEAGGGNPGYARSGRLQPIADARALALAEARAVTARDLWQGKAEWQVVPAKDHASWAPQSGTGLLIHDTLSARIHPARACAALAAAIRARGGRIVAEGAIEGALIEATGWQGLLALSEAMGQPIGNGVKGQACLLRYAAPENAPQLFADALHIVPHSDGTVAIGSTSERLFEHGSETDTQLDDIITRARRAFPVLADAEVVQRWAGVRPRARSRAPMLGGHPVIKGAFVANGGFKIGFGMAPKVGEVMADLILEGKDAIPEGFAPAASLK